MNATQRRRALLVLIVVAASVTYYYTTTASRRSPAAPLKVLGRSAPTPDRLRLGTLELHPCDIGVAARGATLAAYCTTARVPENPDQPGGRGIDLKVAVVPSTAATPASDLLVLLDGGPGGAATEDYPLMAASFADMRRERHLLLIDQRGTGSSNPLSCAGELDIDEADQQEQTQAEREAIDNNRIDGGRLQQQLLRCLERLKNRADPRFYTTSVAIRDLEAVRQAAGAPLLDLVAVSYGTRVAQQYAHAYPSAVRSMLLDSVVPNTLALGSEHALNLDAALKTRFARCSSSAECARRFGDPYRSMYTLRDQLRRHSQSVSVRDPVTFQATEDTAGAADLAVTARLFAYQPMTAALLPLTIDEALHGNFAPLLGQRKLVTETVSERLTDGMGLSVICAEDADLLRPRPEDSQLLLGNTLVDYTLAACEVWPRGTRPADFHEPLRGKVPTLVLAGEIDPVTPLRYAQQVVATLDNARLLIFKGQGHVVLGTGCARRLAGEFVRQLAPRALQAGCLDALGDVPPFLSFSGAAP